MKKSTIYVLIALIILGIIAFFIYKNNPKKLNTKIDLEKKHSNIIEDKNDFYEISINLPEETLDKENKIKNFINNEVAEYQSKWKIGGEVYNEIMQMQKDFPDSPKIKFIYNSDYEKSTSTKYNSVSYKINSYIFEGGAHGLNTVYTFNFNDKGVLNINDILNLEKENAIKISKLLANKFISEQIENIKEQIYDNFRLSFLDKNNKLDLKKCGLGCENFSFQDNLKKFILTDKSIIFQFSQGEIAPSVYGNVEIPLSFEELKSYLR